MPMRAYDPHETLLQCLLPATVEEARSSLNGLLETATLYGFCDAYLHVRFRNAFPRTWRRDPDKLLPDPDQGRMWSDGELKAIELLTYVIPLSYEYVEESARPFDEEEQPIRLGTIPLHEFGFDGYELLYTKQRRERARGWKLLMHLDDHEVYGGFDEDDDDLSVLPRVMSVPSAVWAWDVLRQTCALFPKPLSLLSLALSVINNSTGNVFLDTTAEMPCDDATWTWEVLETLVEQWKEAQALMKEVDRFLAWLERSSSHVKQAADELNLATWTMLMPHTGEEHP